MRGSAIFDTGIKKAMAPSSREISRKVLRIGEIDGLEVVFTKGNALISWRAYWLPSVPYLVQLITVTHENPEQQELWHPVMLRFFDSFSIDGHAK